MILCYFYFNLLGHCRAQHKIIANINSFIVNWDFGGINKRTKPKCVESKLEPVSSASASTSGWWTIHRAESNNTGSGKQFSSLSPSLWIQPFTILGYGCGASTEISSAATNTDSFIFHHWVLIIISIKEKNRWVRVRIRMDGTVPEGWRLRLCYSLVAHFSSSDSASPPRAGTMLISSLRPSLAQRFSLFFLFSYHLLIFLFTSIPQLLLFLLL